MRIERKSIFHLIFFSRRACHDYLHLISLNYSITHSLCSQDFTNGCSYFANHGIFETLLSVDVMQTHHGPDWCVYCERWGVKIKCKVYSRWIGPTGGSVRRYSLRAGVRTACLPTPLLSFLYIRTVKHPRTSYSSLLWPSSKSTMVVWSPAN